MLENIDMEASVLGAILSNNESLYKVIDIINEDCFAEGLHRDIYLCIKELLDTGEQISPYRLYNHFADKLGEKNKNYISSLPSLAKPVTLKSDVKHLNDLANRRSIKRLCDSMQEDINNFDKSGLERAASLASEATKIMTNTKVNNSTTVLEAVDKIVKQMCAETPAYRAKTGIKIVDLGTGGGLQKGRVYAFMAAAKVGKTMMAITISSHLNDHGHKHVFVCAEMGSDEIARRVLGYRLNLPSDALMGKEKHVISKATDAACQMQNNIIFEDVPGVEFEYLKSLIELHVHRNKIEGFILDYYQLVSGCEKSMTQAQHLENVANWIHRVCKRHSIWCVLLVQTNDEQKVLGSRGLNRACDQGYLIERPLDEQGDPVGRDAWLKLRFSRYTRTYNFGDESRPSLRVSENGTHFEELDQYGNVAKNRYGN